MGNDRIAELQDLGAENKTLRRVEDVSTRGVATLTPGADGSHAEAMKEIREVIDRHYGGSVERVAPEFHEPVVERIVLRGDTLPHMEYTLVEEMISLSGE